MLADIRDDFLGGGGVEESSGVGRLRFGTERSRGPLFVSVEDEGVGDLLRFKICSSSSPSAEEEPLRVLKSNTVGVALGEISALVGDT